MQFSIGTFVAFVALATACLASPAEQAKTTKTTSTSTTTSKTTSSKTTTSTTSTSTTSTTSTSTTSTSTTSTSIGVPTPTTTAPPNFNITALGIDGSGCPPGSAFYLLSEDHTAVTITFSEYEASAGPGIDITESRKNCQATLSLVVPQGFSFAVVDVDYRGFYELDSGVNAYHDASYYFQGQLAQSEATSTLTGPVTGANYVYRDEFDLTPTIYSPCGEDTVLNIDSDVRVDNSANPSGSGFVTDDSIDASITQTFNFQWLPC